MKQFLLHPIPIACLIIAIAGALFGSVAAVAVGLIGAVGSVGLLAGRTAQERRSEYSVDELSPDARMLLKPLRKIADDISEIVATHKDSPTVQVVGQEALTESERLIDQVRKSLAARDQLKKSMRGRAEAEKEIGEARMRLEFADETEKASLQAAIDARTMEVEHYKEIEPVLKRVEVSVNQAEAVLAEMKARLSVSATSGLVQEQGSDDLRETIGRLKSLSSGYDEVDQLMRGT